MRTIIKISIFNLAIFFSLIVSSQNEVDALRYSRLMHGGTARSMAMGGAFSSLGADFSTLSMNPAGIAMYKKSEMMFTPIVGNTITEANYLGTLKDEFRYNFNFSNIGVVFAGNLNQKSEKPDFKGFQFGFGLNRQQSFQARANIQGFNENHTILDAYVARANGVNFNNLDPFGTQLAFNTYLIDTVGGSNQYSQAHYGGATQRKTIATKGGINEMVMTFGANYDDRLYFGATIGLPFVSYEELSTYAEIDTDENLPNFQSLTITDELKTYGTGFNMKVGMIFRATDWLRVSGAAHTPTFYSLTDEFSTRMQSKLESIGSFTDKSPIGKNTYTLMTPGRVLGGIGLVFPKVGIFSFDIERVNYANSRLRERDVFSDFEPQNDAIKSTYQAANNYRLGIEILAAPFSFRGGYAYYGSPFKSGINDGSESFITGGLGIRDRDYFFDLAYNYSLKKEDYYLYTLPTIEDLPVKMQTIRHQIVATLGLRF